MGRYGCITTQDVLYVRLAPRRQDRFVPMPVWTRVHYYLRLLGEKWRAVSGSLPDDTFFIFSPGHAEALHSDRMRTPDMVSSDDLGDQYAAVV